MNIGYLDVHGVVVELRTENEEFLEFIRENYSLFLTDSVQNPDVVVNFNRKGIQRAAQQSSELNHIGNDVYFANQSLYWENEFGFKILVEQQRSQLEVFAYHQELIEGQEKNERYKNYMRCMRWAMHYPLFTLCQYDRGWGILHAAAVTDGQQTIAFCGLNKMGKSTLATYLCCNQGYDLLTDNYLLYGNQNIYAFPEVLRLSERSKEMFNLTPIWDHKIYNKYHISPKELGTRLEATVDAFFILSHGEELQVNTLEPKKASETMRNLHTMLAEFPQQGYMAVWPLVSGQTRAQTDGQNLLSQSRWYSLTYEPNWNLEKVIQEVNRCI